MNNKRKMDEALAIRKITKSDDIFLLLDRIHMSGLSNDEPVKKLFCLLLGLNEWEYGHSMEFYEAIINRYADTENLELLHAVSGTKEPYKKLPDPTKRRKQYMIYLSEHEPNNELNEFSTRGVELREKNALRNIARGLYTDFRDDKIFLLCQEWMTEIGLNPDDLKQPKKISKPEKIPIPEGQIQDKKNTGVKKKKKTRQMLTSISITINNKPQNYLIGLVITVLVLSLVFSFSLAYTTLARDKIELFDNIYSYLNKPSIQSISVEENEFNLEPGEEAEPGLMVVPAKADKEHLEYKITDRNIASITTEWTIIGKNGWKKGSDNTADIKIWGDDAPAVQIKVTLKPPYTDSARDGEYENQTNDGKFVDNYDSD